jgi:hypothetical protein
MNRHPCRPPLGLGFSVRNNGPVPLTIVAVKGLRSESPITLAELDPVLPPAGGPGAGHSHLTAHVPLSRSTSQRVRTLPSSSSRMRSYDAVRGHWFARGWDALRERAPRGPRVGDDQRERGAAAKSAPDQFAGSRCVSLKGKTGFEAPVTRARMEIRDDDWVEVLAA